MTQKHRMTQTHTSAVILFQIFVETEVPNGCLYRSTHQPTVHCTVQHVGGHADKKHAREHVQINTAYDAHCRAVTDEAGRGCDGSALPFRLVQQQ